MGCDSGEIGSFFEFENSTIWYSTQTSAVLKSVIAASESARAEAVDVRFAYGGSANPNGTVALSSELGPMPEILLPELPVGSAPEDVQEFNDYTTDYFLSYNRSAVAENGVPCLVRDGSQLREWPIGAVVVRVDGSTMTITEENKVIPGASSAVPLVLPYYTHTFDSL